MKDESVSNVEYLGTCEGNDLRAIARDFDERKITHMAIMYRHENGDIRYHVVGEGLTYLIGMSCRCIIHMHCKDSFVIPEQ